MKLKQCSKEFWVFLLITIFYFTYDYLFPYKCSGPYLSIGLPAALITIFIFNNVLYDLIFGIGYISVFVLMVNFFRNYIPSYYVSDLRYSIIFNYCGFLVLYGLIWLAKLLVKPFKKDTGLIKKILFTILLLLVILIIVIFSIAMLAPPD